MLGSSHRANLGTHMALHMSIGLLFLGGGRASLSRSRKAIAALLVAFFPRFPRSTEDNQYHLQPLRHMWVLAVAWRGFKAIDVETGKNTRVPLEIEVKRVNYLNMSDTMPQSGVMQTTTPCLLPPVEEIVCIQVKSERYYSIRFNVSQK